MYESHKYVCSTKGYNDCRCCTLHKALDPLSFMETSENITLLKSQP